MKRKILISVIFAFILVLMLTAAVFATDPHELTVNDVVYEDLDDGTIRITGYRSDYADIIIPETIGGKTVTKIGEPYSSDRAMPFLEKDLTSVVIPDTVTYIGYSAFAQNDNLTDVTLGSNLEVIDERAFFSDKISNIDIPDKVTTIGQAAFDYNSLTSVEIPDSVTTIGKFAFDRNELTSVTLSKNLTRIEDNTFAVNQIDSIIIPEKVTYIGDGAFGSNQLQEINIPENVTYIGDGAFGRNQLQEINIPEKVTYIGKYAFQKNQLQEIDIPENATEIGIFAFTENKLHTISWNDNDVIPEGVFSKNSIKDLIIPDVVTSIGKEAFNFNKLETIELGDNLESIGEEAFANYIYNDHKVNSEEYNHISNLEIPDSVISIGDKAFFNNQLETVILGNRLESIGEQVFQYNHISNLEIPDSVTSIGNKAFYYNEQMESVDLGSGVQTIGYYTFRGNSIKEVIIPESVQTVQDRAFFDNNLTKVTIENKDTELIGGKYDGFWMQNGVFAPNWYKNKDYEGGGINRICNDERTGPVTYYAYYTVDVTFEENGGSEVTEDVTDQVAHTLLTEPEETTKEGYEFDGWCTDDETFVDQWDFVNDTLTEDMTLYAKWNPQKYTINFESNDGSVIDAVYADYNTTLTEPTAPTKEGYTFEGWYKDSACINAWNFEIDKIPAEDITLYASWTINQYTVTFKDYDGTILDTQTITHGSNAEAPEEPIRSGYRFRNWDKEFTNITSDIIITAEYRKKSSNSNKESKEEISVIVNGKKQTAGTETVKEENEKKIVELRVDADKIKQKIEEVLNENETAEKTTENIVEIPVASEDADSINNILTGDIVKEMDEKKFTVAVKTKDIDYIMPAEEIEIEKVAEKMGVAKDKLKEIEVKVKIEKADDEIVKKMTEMAEENKSEIIVPPVKFTVEAKTKSESGEERRQTISKFSQYVERVIKIPEGVDPSKITTGIVYNADGTFSHVPTEVFIKDGIYYAKINSLTNSAYSVIWNPVTVASVENHWSKESVNDMASRLVIKNPESFEPNKEITRGEFAEYITKAIGVYRTKAAKEKQFTDVEITDELADAVTIAVEYKIIKGYPDGTFKPEKQINREEAMTMYARAMDVVKLAEVDNNRIANYEDASQVAEWAYAAVKKTVSAGVFNGRTETTIVPKGTFTYAEAATAIRNLLIETELINE